MEENKYTYEYMMNDGDPDEVVKWLVAMTLRHNMTNDPEEKEKMIAWVNQNGADIYAVIAAAIYPNLEGIVTSLDFADLEKDVLEQFKVGEPFSKWLKNK